MGCQAGWQVIHQMMAKRMEMMQAKNDDGPHAGCARQVSPDGPRWARLLYGLLLQVPWRLPVVQHTTHGGDSRAPT